MAKKLDWTRKRGITFLVASGLTVLILSYATFQISRGEAIHAGLWLGAFANMVIWCSYLATTVTDSICHALATKLREEIREEVRTEVGKLLKPIDSKIEELDADVSDYGDRRQAEGAALALKIVGQRGNTGRHLNSVE